MLNNEEKESYWREVVNRYEVSGKTYGDFASQEGIRKNRLSYWCNKFRKTESGELITGVNKSEFIPLASSEIGKRGEFENCRIELGLPGGITLRVWGE